MFGQPCSENDCFRKLIRIHMKNCRCLTFVTEGHFITNCSDFKVKPSNKLTVYISLYIVLDIELLEYSINICVFHSYVFSFKDHS